MTVYNSQFSGRRNHNTNHNWLGSSAVPSHNSLSKPLVHFTISFQFIRLDPSPFAAFVPGQLWLLFHRLRLLLLHLHLLHSTSIHSSIAQLSQMVSLRRFNMFSDQNSSDIEFSWTSNHCPSLHPQIPPSSWLLANDIRKFQRLANISPSSFFSIVVYSPPPPSFPDQWSSIVTWARFA